MAITNEQVQEVLERTGRACLMYYPEIHVDDDEYELMDHAAWCIEPVTAELSDDTRDAMTEMLARTIVNPTEHRERTFDVLANLTD